MTIQQRLCGIFKAAKNNAKGLTLIEFSIVLAMTIALIGLALNTTGAFGLSDKYYMKKTVERAFQNTSAVITTTLAAAAGDFEANGPFGSLVGDASEMFTADQASTYCKVLRQSSGKSFVGKQRSAALTYGQVANGEITMGGASGICTSPTS